jgi:hypothetical protein
VRLPRGFTTGSGEDVHPVGAVEDMCSGETNSLGMKHLDWSRCSFDVEPVTGPQAATP